MQIEQMTRAGLGLVCGAVLSAFGCTPPATEDAGTNTRTASEDPAGIEGEIDRTAVVRQEPGKVVYWILPGKRALGPHFGSADNPKFTAELPDDAPAPIRKLISEVPFLIGVPVAAREVAPDGTLRTRIPTPFSDKGVPTSGSFEIHYIDRTTTDVAGPPPKTPDDVKATITFTDPAGNRYDLLPKMVVKPPAPGYQTNGGVMIDAVHHGATGTGSPLMPEVYTYAAFWAVGDIRVNGSIADRGKMMHCMTTETVRNKDYHLVHTSDLPLALDNTIAGQQHHTHCVVLPIKVTPEGPVPEPVNTAFELPNGSNQPFIHVMFEKDEIVSGPERQGPHAD